MWNKMAKLDTQTMRSKLIRKGERWAVYLKGSRKTNFTFSIELMSSQKAKSTPRYASEFAGKTSC